VFRSRKGGSLDQSAVHRIVKAAAERAGLSAEVSAHWLRHAHASHSLDRGAPIHLVGQTLGHSSAAITAVIRTSALPTAQRDTSGSDQAQDPEVRRTSFCAALDDLVRNCLLWTRFSEHQRRADVRVAPPLAIALGYERDLMTLARL
jgi:hypothetical protein